VRKKKMSKEKPFRKSDLIGELSKRLQCTKGDSEFVLQAIGKVIKEELSRVGQLTIHDFGIKYILCNKPATKTRLGTDPRNGERIVIKGSPPKQVVRVRLLKSLREFEVGDGKC
jgi:nucleoid DNA-binding protein